jgi:hypothetical protein
MKRFIFVTWDSGWERLVEAVVEPFFNHFSQEEPG